MAKEQNKSPIEIFEKAINRYYDKIDKELLKFFEGTKKTMKSSRTNQNEIYFWTKNIKKKKVKRKK